MSKKAKRSNSGGLARFLEYFLSLMVVELPIIMIYRNSASGIFVAMLVVGAVAHFILFVGISAFITNSVNKKFEKEYNPIIAVYQEDQDPQKLLEALKNMKNKPKSPMMHNAYYFTLSTAYYGLGEKYSALDALSYIRTSDKKLAAEVIKQRQKISELPNE